MADGWVLRMKSNGQIKFAAFLAVVLLAGALYLQGQSVLKFSLNSLSWIISIVAFSLLVWNKWLWGFKILYPLSKTPYVRGTWRAELNSFWKDPVTGQTRGKIELYLVFRQTFSSLDIV